MADPTTITQVLPAPVLEGSLTAFLKKLDPLIGQQINTAAYAPTIAAESQLQQDARTAAGGLGSLTGAQAYQDFMSPYQQEVIDTTLTEFDRNAAMQSQGLRDSAIQAGAYGGGREGVQRALYQERSDLGRAGLQAQLQAQAFQQAQAAAAQDLAARQGLGTYQTQLGQAGQAQTQAGLDAAAAAAREAQFEPFTRLGLVGQQLAQVQPGAFPTQTVGYQQPQAGVSPLQTALGVGTGIASIGSKLGLFG
jgi:Arc/MetJ-type ribon-helix-helix transcriptional regulator